MKIVLLFAVICAAKASVLQFVHTPSSVVLPESADLRSNDVPVVTSQLIGLSAEMPPGWTGHGDLLSRPKAAAVIVVNTPDHFKPQLTGNTYTLTQTSQGLNLKALEFDFKTSFDDGVVLVDSSSTKLEATNADKLADMNVDGLVKTKITPLRQELENVYRIVLWLEKEGSRLAKHGSPDLYVVRISGLAAALTSAGPSDPDAKAALEEVTQAIEKLSAALRTAYGDQVIVEMITQTAEPEEHIIVKRQAQT
uniref:Renin receptor N-terminal domain-containing protein n=1 Tax=Plectus sambesii TaxID=2011161 RepID=A0A914UNY1_9BILA